ncbi:MAG: hypothetical protein AAB737_02150 [Patescibacteria group bacterium]
MLKYTLLATAMILSACGANPPLTPDDRKEMEVDVACNGAGYTALTATRNKLDAFFPVKHMGKGGHTSYPRLPYERLQEMERALASIEDWNNKPGTDSCAHIAYKFTIADARAEIKAARLQFQEADKHAALIEKTERRIPDPPTH